MWHVLPRGALEDPANSTLAIGSVNTYYVLYWRKVGFVLYCTTVLYYVHKDTYASNTCATHMVGSTIGMIAGAQEKEVCKTGTRGNVG